MGEGREGADRIGDDRVGQDKGWQSSWGLQKGWRRKRLEMKERRARVGSAGLEGGSRGQRVWERVCVRREAVWLNVRVGQEREGWDATG